MKVFVLLSLFAFSLANSKSADPRGLSLFNVVKFPNSECQAKSDAALTGTCFSETECSDKNGVKDGNCAQGFGACCIFQVNTCAGSVTYNNSYVENPGYPQKFLSTETSPCAYTVKRMQSNICQVRLDFTDLELTAPGTGAGDCATDSLVIAPGATNTVAQSKPPTLCGTSTGQHVYVDAGTADTVATLTFTIGTPGTSTGNWRIKVSQIECSSEYKPPNGCLQYFMGAKNTITSFNFDGTSACTPYCHLQNQDYNICFKQEKGMCGMEYVENSAATDAFQLNANNAATAIFQAGNCGNSGLQIPVGPVDYAVSHGIYCGSNLASGAAATPNVVSARAGEFKIRAYAATTQATIAGFSIDARQVPC